MNESALQSKLKSAFERNAGLVLNVHGHAMQQKGWPDLQVYHRVWTGHLELKVNDRVKDHQRKIMEGLRLRGTEVWVLRWKEDVLWLQDIDGETNLQGMEIDSWNDAKLGMDILKWLDEYKRI